jgi:hypothetical protein
MPVQADNSTAPRDHPYCPTTDKSGLRQLRLSCGWLGRLDDSGFRSLRPIMCYRTREHVASILPCRTIPSSGFGTGTSQGISCSFSPSDRSLRQTVCPRIDLSCHTSRNIPQAHGSTLNSRPAFNFFLIWPVIRPSSTLITAYHDSFTMARVSTTAVLLLTVLCNYVDAATQCAWQLPRGILVKVSLTEL